MPKIPTIGYFFYGFSWSILTRVKLKFWFRPNDKRPRVSLGLFSLFQVHIFNRMTIDIHLGLQGCKIAQNRIYLLGRSSHEDLAYLALLTKPDRTFPSC